MEELLQHRQAVMLQYCHFLMRLPKMKQQEMLTQFEEQISAFIRYIEALEAKVYELQAKGWKS